MLRKIIAFLLFTISCMSPAFSDAQSMEQLLFDKLCSEIYRQNIQFLIKKKLNGEAVLVEDPVTGEQEIVYQSNNAFVVDFKKRPRNEQLAILGSIELPNLPLLDTVYIRDSINAFSPDLISKFGDKVFIHDGIEGFKASYSLIVFRSLILRNNMFILSCGFPDNSFVSTYSLTFEKGKFTTTRLGYFFFDDPHFSR